MVLSEMLTQLLFLLPPLEYVLSLSAMVVIFISPAVASRRVDPPEVIVLARLFRLLPATNTTLPEVEVMLP